MVLDAHYILLMPNSGLIVIVYLQSQTNLNIIRHSTITKNTRYEHDCFSLKGLFYCFINSKKNHGAFYSSKHTYQTAESEPKDVKTTNPQPKS